MDFRRDINGLRAWAVMAVVLFHFDFFGFSGGFVGVDVFFVISGFLMTQIIINGLMKNEFSFKKFFLARVRRILPALMLLCAVVMAFGWFVLEDTGYRVLMRHVGSTLLFGSNFKYWREAGYFDDVSHEKLLLHTWSLSVEWQFYMLLPIVLAVVWKLFKTEKSLFWVVFLGFGASFWMSVNLSPSEPSASFFLLHTRAWEMLAGSLVFFGSRLVVVAGAARPYVGWFGFVLVVLSIIWMKPTQVWPGYWAVIPVIGASLILWSNFQGWVTNNPISQSLGHSSYSIYLWHWPLAAILNFSENAGIALQIIFLILALFLGYLSYKFVETPAKNAFFRIKNFGWYFLLTFVFILLLGAYTYENSKVGWRIPDAARAIYKEAKNINPGQSKCHVNMSDKDPGCVYGGEKLGVILIGDSHAQAVTTALQAALPDQQLHVRDWSQPACATIMGLQPASGSDRFCPVENLYEAAKQYDADVPLVIVNRLAANFSGQNEKAHAEPNWYIKTRYQDDKEKFQQEIHKAVVDTACAFAQYRQVYMLRPIPELKRDVPSVMGKTMALFGEYRRVSVSWEEYLERTALVRQAQDAAAEQCGVKILDPTPYLCKEGRCWGDVEGQPIYVDDDHLSLRGSALLVPEFRKIFQ